MEDPSKLLKGKLKSSLSLIICLSLLLKSTMSQLLVPGHIPVAYLTPDCTEFALTGLHKLNIVSQIEETYKPDIDCTLYLSLQGSYLLQFTIEHLHLEHTVNNGCSDYVQLFNGHGVKTELSPKLCGKRIPSQTFLSNSSNVALRFRTNGTKQHSGFRLKYESIRKSKLDTMACSKTKAGSSCEDQVGKAGNCATHTATGVSVIIAVMSILSSLVVGWS